MFQKCTQVILVNRFIHFKWVIVHCINILQFINFTNKGHLGLSPVFCYNRHRDHFLHTWSLSMWAHCFRMEWLGHRVSAFVNLVRYYTIALQSGCANLHSYQASERVSISPYRQYLVLSIFFPISMVRNGIYLLFKFAWISLFTSLSIYFLFIEHSSFLFCDLFVSSIVLTFAERPRPEIQSLPWRGFH